MRDTALLPLWAELEELEFCTAIKESGTVLHWNVDKLRSCGQGRHHATVGATWDETFQKMKGFYLRLPERCF